jgi:hypothetical protein
MKFLFWLVLLFSWGRVVIITWIIARSSGRDVARIRDVLVDLVYSVLVITLLMALHEAGT